MMIKVRKLRDVALIALLFLLAARANAEIRIAPLPSGMSLYARVQTASSPDVFFAVALAEGSGGALHNYVATDAQILTAATTLADNTTTGYHFVVYIGTPSTSADDPFVGDGKLGWKSNAEAGLFQISDAYAAAAAIKVVTDKIATMLTASSGNFTFTTDAVKNAPSGTGSTVSPVIATDDDTWGFDDYTQVTSPKILVEKKTVDLFKAVDMSRPVGEKGSINNIVSVTVTAIDGKTAPTITSSALSLDRKKVMLTIDASEASSATWTITVKIITSDSRPRDRDVQLTIQ